MYLHTQKLFSAVEGSIRLFPLKRCLLLIGARGLIPLYVTAAFLTQLITDKRFPSGKFISLKTKGCSKRTKGVKDKF